jgi:hypothetical protein
MFENDVVEPLRIKTQAINAATEAAIMILRIDDVIASSVLERQPRPGCWRRHGRHDVKILKTKPDLKWRFHGNSNFPDLFLELFFEKLIPRKGKEKNVFLEK